MQIVRELKALNSSNSGSPVRKPVKKKENVVDNRQGDIRIFLKGPEL